MLFDRIRAVVKTGTSVIYITHRLAELRQIAHRVTVLRDGRVRGVALVSDVTDQDLLSMIVGRALGSTFPPKARGCVQGRQFVRSGSERRKIQGCELRRFARTNHRRRRRRGQRPVRVDAGARRASAVPRRSPPRRPHAQAPRTLARSGVHAVGSADGRVGDRPYDSRERVYVGAGEIRLVRNCQTQDGSRTRHKARSSRWP